MDVLEDQRERLLTPVLTSRLAHGAGGRVAPERLVVRAAVVVAGEAEETGKRQDQQRRRERHPRRNPGRLRAEPRVRRIAPDFRRVERRQVGPVGVMRVLKCRPGRVPDKRRQTDEDRQRGRPPDVAAGCRRRTRATRAVPVLLPSTPLRGPSSVALRHPAQRPRCHYLGASILIVFSGSALAASAVVPAGYFETLRMCATISATCSGFSEPGIQRRHRRR